MGVVWVWSQSNPPFKKSAYAPGLDREALVSEQQSDPSLKCLHERATQGRDGYIYVNGLLVHDADDALGDVLQKMVLPVGRRQTALTIAHGSRFPGHFGRCKTHARLVIHCTLPNMWWDVGDH